MAPKTGETSRKGEGKTKASTSESWEMERFISRVYSSVVEHVAANQEIPEIPQGMHFPPHKYWEQINTSLGELSSNMGQLRVEHQEHSIILHEIREDQKAMKEEQQRQGRDIEELKDIICSSRRKHHHH